MKSLSGAKMGRCEPNKEKIVPGREENMQKPRGKIKNDPFSNFKNFNMAEIKRGGGRLGERD